MYVLCLICYVSPDLRDCDQPDTSGPLSVVISSGISNLSGQECSENSCVVDRGYTVLPSSLLHNNTLHALDFGDIYSPPDSRDWPFYAPWWSAGFSDPPADWSGK